MACSATAEAAPEDGSFAHVFGSGRDEPYERALRRGHGRLVLHGSPTRRRIDDVSRFAGPADDVDLRVLGGLLGPVLDVGCGPGRMVAAALGLGVAAVGIDVSAAAVELAAGVGLPVLRRSIFDRLQPEGRWSSVLLLDGNIGIGGDPAALLARCAELLAPGGAVVAEVDPEPGRGEVFSAVLAGEAGEVSAPFAWAEVGHRALEPAVRAAGLNRAAAWTDSGRSFVRLVAAE